MTSDTAQVFQKRGRYLAFADGNPNINYANNNTSNHHYPITILFYVFDTFFCLTHFFCDAFFFTKLIEICLFEGLQKERKFDRIC